MTTADIIDNRIKVVEHYGNRVKCIIIGFFEAAELTGNTHFHKVTNNEMYYKGIPLVLKHAMSCIWIDVNNG